MGQFLIRVVEGLPLTGHVATTATRIHGRLLPRNRCLALVVERPPQE